MKQNIGVVAWTVSLIVALLDWRGIEIPYWLFYSALSVLVGVTIAGAGLYIHEGVNWMAKRARRSQRRGPVVGGRQDLSRNQNHGGQPALIHAAAGVHIGSIQFHNNRTFYKGLPPAILKLGNRASIDEFDANGNHWFDTTE